MSHFECRLNLRFWCSKKVVQVVQIGGRGGGGNLDKIQKKNSRDVFPSLLNETLQKTLEPEQILFVG